MKLVPRLAATSVVAVLFMIGLFVLLTFSETLEGPGPVLLAAVLGVSLPSGILLGFLMARRIWSRCMPEGTHRTKPAYWLIPILILVPSVGFSVVRLVSLHSVFLQSVFLAYFGEFGVFATVASGNPLGVEGAILLMFVHALAVGSLFSIAGFIEKQSGTREISGLKGIRQRMPLTSTLLVFSSCAAIRRLSGSQAA